jgi:hypothetical protein
MEKKSGDSFHYFHFLRSAADMERKEAPAPDATPQAVQSQADELFKQIAG